ncbi:DUF2218 domain-containing protein (plasmid) [Streptomyces sp. WAC07094]|uniref:DUF2218 domain-containing protein n=1 Tax=Streptomyces sp. WAC07094 TaxID=3072183 RepID=UPI002ECB1DB3|nr:DUF2218 domain-containing protein [Streptomyces sp. WAC07094]
MLIAEADIRTERPSRYLEELRERYLEVLREHSSEMCDRIPHRPHPHDDGTAPPQIRIVEWTDARGTIDLVEGRCTLQAGPDSLTLRVEAADRDSLQRIQHLVTGRMQKIGERDALVTWRQADADHQPHDPATDSARKAASHPRRRAALGLIAIIVLVVAVHLGLGGLLVASSWGTHWVIGVVMAIIVLHVLSGLVIRRRKPRRTR